MDKKSPITNRNILKDYVFELKSQGILECVDINISELGYVMLKFYNGVKKTWLSVNVGHITKVIKESKNRTAKEIKIHHINQQPNE